MEPQQFHPTSQPAEQPEAPATQPQQPNITPPPSASNNTPPKKKRSPLIIVLAIAIPLLAVAVVAAFLILRSHSSKPNSVTQSTTTPSQKSNKKANPAAVMPAGFVLFETPCYSFGIKELDKTAQTNGATDCNQISVPYGQNTGDALSVTPLAGSYKTVGECNTAHKADITADPSLTRTIVNSQNITLDDTAAIKYITDKENPQSDDIAKHVRIVAFNPDKTYQMSSGDNVSCFLIDNSHWDDFTIAQTDAIVSTWRWKY